MTLKKINTIVATNKALQDILKNYSQIKTADIERFAPVYYPIAIIEIEFDEQTFEDFDTVQLTILQLVNAGVSDADVISASMGLGNPDYVYNVLELLKGYGHIDDKGVTELGKMSLQQEKKITKIRASQQVQLDPLNGNLIKYKQNLNPIDLMSTDETKYYIGHLDACDGIWSEYVVEQLNSAGIDHFKKYKSSVLNANVLQIHEINCLEVQYAPCYFIKLKSVNMPVIFGSRFNAVSKKNKERHYWEPLSVCEDAAKTYFKNESIHRNSEDANKYIFSLASMLEENFHNIDIIKEIEKVFDIWNFGFLFSNDTVYTDSISPSRCAVIKARQNDFQKYNKTLLDIFDSMADNGEFLLACPTLYGNIVSMITEDEYIWQAVAVYRELRKREEQSAIDQKIRSYLSDYSPDKLRGEELFRTLIEYMNSLLN